MTFKIFGTKGSVLGKKMAKKKRGKPQKAWGNSGPFTKAEYDN